MATRSSPSLLLSLGFLFHWMILCCNSDPGPSCPKTNISLLNFTSQFVMVQHQLRGVLSIVDDCSFRVSEFDMFKGSDVRWWGALGNDFENLTKCFAISDQKLNQTYENDSFVVNLMNNVTWDRIRVVAVWDIPTASDIGHVILSNPANGSKGLAPWPLPVNGSGSGNVSVWVQGQPTMLENCKELAKNYGVRWTLGEKEDVIDIGLEAAIGVQNYMAFGWGNPNSCTQVMVGGDVAVAGFTEESLPFADDYYITKYSQCTKTANGSVEDFSRCSV